jgi:hypothetical protein
MPTLTVIGGANVGWVHASWPFAKLVASPNSLKLSGLLGSYELTPGDVASLEPSGSIPFLSSGMRIVHTRNDYPKRMLFYAFGSPRKLIEKIRASGFIPAATQPQRSAQLAVFPFRWSVLVILVAFWNLLLFADQKLPGADPHHPGPLTLFALATSFFVSWLGLRSEWAQSLLMREGESVGRIKPFLVLLLLVSGAILVMFSVTFIGARVAG